MSSKPGIVRRFFAFFWNLLSFTRVLVFNLLFLLLLIVFVSALMGPPLPELRPGSALVLDPGGMIVEEESYINPLAGLLGGPLAPATVGESVLRDLLEAIERAGRDSEIRAI